MTTVAEMVRDTRNTVAGGMNDQINVLASSHAVGGDTLVFRYAIDTLAPGMTLSVGLGTFQVLDVSPLTKQATVINSPDGGPDLAIDAGAIVRIRPRFTDWSIFTLINTQIAEMSSTLHGLYGVLEWSQTVSTTTNAYPVDPSIAEVLTDIAAAYLVLPGINTVVNWPKFQIVRTDFGMTIRILDPDGLTFGGTLTFVGKRGFAPAIDMSTDPVGYCGLAETMLDIPVLGAAAYLMWSGEGRRNQLLAQGDTRRPDEVPPGGNTGSAREMFRQRDERIRAEYARLVQSYPPVKGRW